MFNEHSAFRGFVWRETARSGLVMDGSVYFYAISDENIVDRRNFEIGG